MLREDCRPHLTKHTKSIREQKTESTTAEMKQQAISVKWRSFDIVVNPWASWISSTRATAVKAQQATCGARAISNRDVQGNSQCLKSLISILAPQLVS